MENDKFSFKFHVREHSQTKRGILSVTSSVFDPLGFAGPVILPAKQLLQVLCKENLSWDEPIPDKLLVKWERWLRDLPLIEKLNVDRCYKPENFGPITNCQLHLFSDASDVGYGVVAYLRFENERNEVCCSFVMAKSRVAPLAKVTVPRMELTAATTAARMSKLIERDLKYTLARTVFWTDSMSVLRYIRNETARFHTFVANRVTTIREASNPQQWRFVNSKLKPADLASRGATMTKFLSSERWTTGPEFLKHPENFWPIEEAQTEILDQDPEVKKPRVHCVVKIKTGEETFDKFLTYFSDWYKLKRAAAYLIIIKTHLRSKINHGKGEESCTLEKKLSRDILEEAERSLISYAQRKAYGEEIACLTLKKLSKTGIKTVPKTSALYKLDPIFEEGILRVGGRLERAQLQYNAKHPAIIPKASPLARLLLADIHISTGHSGKTAMLAALRQNYWIPGASSLVKSITSGCVQCRKYKAATQVQKMADLPADRLIPGDPPFTKVGMDYFGPFQVKRGRAAVKRYGVIFTCLTSRAVHLEVAHSLDTDSCINAIRRFVARRGPAKVILSDNGTNLVGAERVMREAIENWNQSKIMKTLLQQNIEWKFNPPYASHHGGVWERIIRSIRKIMYSLMDQQVNHLDDECLMTLFCEIESILNGRPITKNSDHPSDLGALTPNHLLLLHKSERCPPGQFCEDNTLRNRWRQVQYLADQFWKRWVREYLPLLQERQKWFKTQRNTTTGDIVLVIDNQPRHAWALGKVVSVRRDKKGMVRIAEVQTKNGTVLRPITKLCTLLEADEV